MNIQLLWQVLLLLILSLYPYHNIVANESIDDLQIKKTICDNFIYYYYVTYDSVLNKNCSPDAPSGSGNQFFCLVDHPTVSELQASGTNIQWYETATSIIPINLNVFLESGQDYFATQTVNGCESTDRLQVLAFLDDPGTPTGDNVQEFCEGDNPTIASLLATGSGIQWYATAVGTNPLNPNVVLTSGDDYFATKSNGSCESDIRFQVIVLIGDTNPPIGINFQEFCTIDNPTIQDLAISGVNVQWYLSETTSVPLLPNVSLLEGADYFATQTIGNCESSVRFQVTVSLDDPPAPTVGNAVAVYCASDNPLVSDLMATGMNLKWYGELNSPFPLSPNVELENGADYFATQTINGCESTSRLQVLVTFINPPVPASPTGDGIVSYCYVDEPTVSDLIAIGTNIQWYEDETSTNPLDLTTLLIDGENYFASEVESDCESTERLQVDVILSNPLPPSTDNATQIFCSSDNATIADLSAIGNNIVWYQDATSSIALPSNIALQDGADYFASQEDNACESSLRLQVDVVITDVPNLALLVNPLDVAICGFGSTIIQIMDSEMNVEYQLKNAITADDLGTPVLGNGGVINLPTGDLSTTTFFEVQATSIQNTNCQITLVSQATVVVAAEPSVANAGNDMVICNETIFNLNANIPNIGIGSWSLISGDNNIIIDNPDTNNSSVSNLIAGAYILQWEVNNGICSGLLAAKDSVTVIISEISASQVVTDVSTVNGTDGLIAICIEGGTNPFNIVWSPDNVGDLMSTTSTICSDYYEISNLPSGIYDVVIEDGNACNVALSDILIEEPDCSNFEISNITSANESCSENNDASITIETMNGLGDIVFDIGNSVAPIQSNNDAFTFDNLSSGTYDITVVDERLCEFIYATSIVIEEPDVLEPSVVINHPSEIGNTDGFICVSPIGGTAPFIVSSSCGAFFQGTNTCGGDFFLENLGAGSCELTIEDANGCIYSESLVLLDPACDDFVFSTVEAQDLFCDNDGSGSIQITVSNGIAPYQYSIDGGLNYVSGNSSTYQFNNLDEGDFQVMVLDAVGCLINNPDVVTINNPDAIGIDLSNSSNYDCFGNGEASIIAVVTGGTFDYSYVWSDGSVSLTNENLATGEYTITVTDVNGCTAAASISILNAQAFSSDIEVNGVSVISTGISLGESVEIELITDAINANITWIPNTGLSSNNSTTVTASPTESTNYTVFIVSEEGCTDSLSIMVNIINEHTVIMPTAFSPNGDDNNDGFYPISEGIVTIHDFRIYNRWGELIHQGNTPWDGNYKGKEQAIDTYVYVIVYETINKKSTKESGDFLLVR